MPESCSWRWRATASSHWMPSNHQWPKSSASKGEQRMGGMASLKPGSSASRTRLDVVGGVGPDALGGVVGVVGLLVGHVDLGAGDAPVAMSAGPALFVEVEVGGVAGVAGVAGPDLDAGAGVAGKDGGGVRVVVLA